MDNYYDLLEVLSIASTREIMMAYENKITKYNNLRVVTATEVDEIKKLKMGLHILTNPVLRKKYDMKMNLVNVNTNDPLPVNQDGFDSLDSVFQVDNSWMPNTKTDIIKKKENLNNDFMSDRIFSMSQLNQRPTFPSNLEAQLRKPQQCRDDRSRELMNN